MSSQQKYLPPQLQFASTDLDRQKMKALQRAAEERFQIVIKYAKGEDSEGEDDHWEDSAFKVYKVTDRYGFLHETELSEIPTFEEERRKHAEVKRQYKWLKMIHRWKAYEGTEKLRSRVYKGIPLNMRSDAWRLMLDVGNLIQKNLSVYDEMKERAKSYSPDIRQIDLDVNRTYRNHIMFRTRYSIKQQQLFYVLAAYSMYNTEVGYCQGMSQIAAVLLMFMGEEEAFWALHSLLYDKKHRMHGFFIPGFPKLIRFQDHHDKILKKFLPRLKKHLDKNEVFTSLYTMKWFFQCFLDRAPFPLTLRLWDAYMLDGERILVAMSYTTLKMHKTIIKKMEMDEVVSFLQESLAENFGSDDDTVIEQLKLSMAELKRAKMISPPSPGENETAKIPFGVSVKPSFEQATGVRVPPKADNARRDKIPGQDYRSQSKQTNLNSRENHSKVNGSIPVSSGVQKSTSPGVVSSSNQVTSSDGRDEKYKSSTQRGRREPTQETVTDGRKSRSDPPGSPVKKENSQKAKQKEKSKGDRKSRPKQENRKPNAALENEAVNSSDNPRLPQHQLTSSTPESRVPLPSSPVKAPQSPQHYTQSENKRRSDGNGVVIWKTPSPTKVFPSPPFLKESNLSTSDENPIASQNKALTDQITSMPKTNNEDVVKGPVTGTASFSPKKPQNKDPLKHKNRTKANRTKAQLADLDEETSTLHVNFESSLDHKRNEQVAFNLTRPYSEYDNIKNSSGCQNGDHVITECNPLMNTSTPINRFSHENDFETEMEKSLESLRELAAGLSPSRHSQGYSPSPSCSIGDNSSRLDDGPGRRNAALSPPNYVGMVEVDSESTGMPPLDNVTHSFYNRSDILQSNKQSSSRLRSLESLDFIRLPKPSNTIPVNTERVHSSAMNAHSSDKKSCDHPYQFKTAMKEASMNVYLQPKQHHTESSSKASNNLHDATASSALSDQPLMGPLGRFGNRYFPFSLQSEQQRKIGLTQYSRHVTVGQQNNITFNQCSTNENLNDVTSNTPQPTADEYGWSRR